MGFGVEGLGLRVWGLGFRVWGCGFGVGYIQRAQPCRLQSSFCPLVFVTQIQGQDVWALCPRFRARMYELCVYASGPGCMGFVFNVQGQSL